ncbi:polysaccharide biosynthesis/export family protein [bacterium]|nr:polysaccharide biosynthesis/export family protein [bacterium]
MKIKQSSLLLIISIIFFSCSSKKNILYLKGSSDWTNVSALNQEKVFIEAGDILKVEVFSTIKEASLPYNRVNTNNLNVANNIELMKLEGYLVSDSNTINFPVLGKISTKNLSFTDLESKIKHLLQDGQHLLNADVSVRRLNSKFTILGEVRNPGTFSYFENNMNIFQALGYAGDMTIEGKRKDVKVLRKENNITKSYVIDLTSSDILNSPIFYIKNNDVVIVNPTFSKVKSAGFIGSPSSIASMASLALSITLLLINN